MTSHTEINQEQWLMSSKNVFSIVKEDEQSLAYLIEYLKKQHQKNAIVRHIRGKKCIKLAALMDEWAAALQFPLYFGENLNAFVDCMRSLPQTHNINQIIVISDAHLLLTNEPDTAANFWEVLKYVVQLPQSDLNTPFKIILQVETEADHSFLQTQFKDWGITYDQLQGDWSNLYLGLSEKPITKNKRH